MCRTHQFEASVGRAEDDRGLGRDNAAQRLAAVLKRLPAKSSPLKNSRWNAYTARSDP